MNSTSSEALEQQLLCEHRLVEELKAKNQGLNIQLDEVIRREAELRIESTSFEKTITILKHELKEVTHLPTRLYIFSLPLDIVSTIM